jgi:hypothetical protein
MTGAPDWQFISEPITPEKGSFDVTAMATGLASLPSAFTWRGERFEITECLEHVKQSTRESFSGEMYLRRQQFTVRLDDGRFARIYVQRSAGAGQSRQSAKQRWFLYAIASGDEDDESAPEGTPSA